MNTHFPLLTNAGWQGILMKEERNQNQPKFQVSAFYKFVSVEEPELLKQLLDAYLAHTTILGTVLVAHEGVNGTISGPAEQVDAFLSHLKDQLEVDELPYKVAKYNSRPFHRMKVRLKKEIVTLGVEGIDPNQSVGTYVKPQDWNDLITRDDVTLVDTRNDYEYQVGTFKGAINPDTKSFREFPEYVDQNMDPETQPKVAMFCTGGIRCEKATALMLQKGFKEVYHLEGGILEYFNQIPESDSTWEGECFVFDDRVTVNQQLEKGSYEMCHACRMPLTEAEMESEYFEEGVSCPYCHGTLADEKIAGLKQRNFQMQLAKERNTKHLGEKQKRHRAISEAGSRV